MNHVYSYISPTGEGRCVTVKMPLTFDYACNGEESVPSPSPCEVIIERDMDSQYTALGVEECSRGEYIGKKYKIVFKFVDTDDLYGFCEQLREAMSLVRVAIETNNIKLPRYSK